MGGKVQSARAVLAIAAFSSDIPLRRFVRGTCCMPVLLFAEAFVPCTAVVFCAVEEAGAGALVPCVSREFGFHAIHDTDCGAVGVCGHIQPSYLVRSIGNRGGGDKLHISLLTRSQAERRHTLPRPFLLKIYFPAVLVLTLTYVLQNRPNPRDFFSSFAQAVKIGL